MRRCVLLIACLFVLAALGAAAQAPPGQPPPTGESGAPSPGTPDSPSNAESSSSPAGSPALPTQDHLPVVPIEGFRVLDAPNDEGKALLLEWRPSPGEATGAVTGYTVLRRDAQTDAVVPALGWRAGDRYPPQGWTPVAQLPAGSEQYIDRGLRRGEHYVYAIVAMNGETPVVITPFASSTTPRVQYFYGPKVYLLINLLVVSAAILVSVFLAARGREFTIRKIAGLDAVEEAVGRATEMGKPVLFVPGIQDMDNVQTVAGITILGSIAHMTAHYETALNVPVSKSLVMSTARETVKEAYATVGRPDLYHEDMVHYVTDEQFGYVAAIDGYMLRDRPATCFYMGAFFAESLILAETGNSIGAIQIAGTAQPTQLPFFVAACDYTLIGEELFAASAYLSKNPSLLGSLRGQDIGKALAMLFILAGAGAATIGGLTGGRGVFAEFGGFLQRFFATNF